jgi:ParB family chromosome partitioning protein
MSKRLDISRKTLNDLMAFLRVPDELAAAIPNFKHLSRAMAVKLATLAKDKTILNRLIELGPKIGKKMLLTSNIEKFVYQTSTTPTRKNEKIEIKDTKGHALFNIITNSQGTTTIKIKPNLANRYDIDDLKNLIYQYLIDCKDKEGALDEP